MAPSPPPLISSILVNTDFLAKRRFGVREAERSEREIFIIFYLFLALIQALKIFENKL